MKYIKISLLHFLLTLLTACNADTNSEQVTLTISAAASLSDALTEVKEQYEKEHENVEVILNFGGSGSLGQQIKQGAPVDVFFSAAEEPFQDLVKDKLIDTNNQADIVQNTLVLITPKNKNINNLEALTDSSIKKIAVGTPEIVPAGLYAKETLVSSDLWDVLQGKMVMAKDVRQVLTYVETGNVDAGFVYQTDTLESTKINIGLSIENTEHRPILYPAGVITGSKHKKEAIEFYQYLKSNTALKTFQNYGFGTIK